MAAGTAGTLERCVRLARPAASDSIREFCFRESWHASRRPWTWLDSVARYATRSRPSIRAPGLPNSIVFNIPKSDPGYNPSTGTFTISPFTELPQITKPVLIDGTTESSFLGQPALVRIDGN